jgi:hypothetical protein
MQDSGLKERFVESLVAHVEQDRYPSNTTMDEIERLASGRLRERYVQVLMKKVADDRYPSPDLMRRVGVLVR